MAGIGRRVAATAVLLALLSGCAQPVRLSGPQVAFWAGRMALRVEADQAQSFSAAFELKGDAQAGELSLFSPLGATIAQMAWKPGEARLRSDGKELHFGSLDALTRHATGTEPFALPQRWLDRKSSLKSKTVYNYVTTADTHGGNSGSPSVNAKGEVVGILFDGNLESLPNRFVYREERERSVHVASQGIVEALRTVYGARRLLAELGL